MPAPMRLRLIWNVDMSISIYHRHTLIHKAEGVLARRSVDAFCEGWFGTKDQTQWKTKWYYKTSKKEQVGG